MQLLLETKTSKTGERDVYQAIAVNKNATCCIVGGRNILALHEIDLEYTEP